VRANPHPEAHPEELLSQAVRGELAPGKQAILDRHLAACPDCALEFETARVFALSGAPDDHDEALNRAVVESVLGHLDQSNGVGETLRKWFKSRSRWRTSAVLAVLGATAVFAIGLTVHRARRPAPLSLLPPMSEKMIILDDGSEVEPLAGASVKLVEQSPNRTTLQLRSGSAHFRVRHNPRRVFRVDVGAILIEDLGTTFVVDHLTGGEIRVTIAEGRVAVLSVASGERVELGAGEDRVFPIPPETRESPPTEVDPSQTRESATTTTPSRGQIRPHGAEEATAWLQAADYARRSRHPEAAVVPLQRLIDHYPKDPRAPSAAFTLGWILLTDLARPREAAVAFAEAERHAPRGLLAEDAAARVAEAWQKAGDSRRAALAAHHYEKLYPTGRYLTLMRGLAGEP